MLIDLVILNISFVCALVDIGYGLENRFTYMEPAVFPPDRTNEFPLGKPGMSYTYDLDSNDPIPESVVKSFTLSFGPVEERNANRYQWLQLRSAKTNGEYFTVWILTHKYPSPELHEAQTEIARYILQEGESGAREFLHPFTGESVLPVLGAWKFLLPRDGTHGFSNPVAPPTTFYLGLEYSLRASEEPNTAMRPATVNRIELLPDALIGVPGNTKQKEDRRRYDDSDYEYVRLTQADYEEMIDSGLNCFRVEPGQVSWYEDRNVFYWGIGGKEIHYPEYLYRSNYLGPVLYMDEPMVSARDYVIRPRLKEDREFRRNISPQACFAEFQKYFLEAQNKGNPHNLIRELKSRPDVDVGAMEFLQQNIYTWDTFASSALYQLSEDKMGPPHAFVFEPPGRFGSRRILPEMNMAYQCQIPVDDPGNLIDIIYGFLRGSARLTNKEWGTSIYGAVDRADSYWFLTHAYDQGAQLFFFWDTYRLACVPYRECLSLARHLRGHIESHPNRNLRRLKQSGEVAILLPVGYNLGHVHMGRGNLWGLEELNLERRNRHGVPYRTVMNHFFVEIERCIRMGIAFDLFWDLEQAPIHGYREIVHIQEDGGVEVETNGNRVLYDGARTPQRPDGTPPRISIVLAPEQGTAPLAITARAVLREGSSPVYYTPGADEHGVYHNRKIFWELYGPEEEDYRAVNPVKSEPVIQIDSHTTALENHIQLANPGIYRLRASACDLAGRTAVEWKKIVVKGKAE